MSLPARLALTDGLLSSGTVLDFGCGRGGDVRRLADSGVDIVGWDPHFRPHPAPAPADVVLCNYVLNVIPDQAEREATLRRASELARRILVVAVRGTHEARHLHGADHGDGRLTSRGTFHHLFSPAELREWTEGVLHLPVVPVHPGIAYVFRSTAERASYLSRRYGGWILPDEDGVVLQRLVRFLEANGRAPTPDEQPELCRDAKAAYGRLTTALGLARREADPALIDRSLILRHRDLLVVLGLERFHGGPKMSDLPADRIADVRALYGSLRDATTKADQFLMATGNPDLIRDAVRRSPIGKTSPTALYVHVDAERHLHPVLRLYAACGGMVAGRPEDTTLVKLHHDRLAVSFLTYPAFDRDPHPKITGSLTVDLPRLSARWTDWSDRSNRPLLHRKEAFLHPEDSRFERFQRLTRSEIRAGLYDDPERIGREVEWAEILRRRGYALRGHRLVRANVAPTDEGTATQRLS